VDFFAQLDPAARTFAFQFKAPRGRDDQVPNRFTLVRERHEKLHELAQASPYGVLYVLPFYASHEKLEHHVPALLQDTWCLSIMSMAPSDVFGANRSKVVRCCPGTATVNPEYPLRRASDVKLSLEAGIPVKEFASWYTELCNHKTRSAKSSRRMNPWIVRGLRVVIIESVE